MSAFEFIFTANTIILALVMARLLEGMRDTFDRRRRYWIHYLWVVNRLLLVFGTLVMAFENRDRTGQDALFLLLVVVPSAALFLQVNALVTTQPREIASWKEHYWGVKKWFFGTNVFYLLSVFVLTTHFLLNDYGPAVTIPQRYAVPTIGIVLSIIGYNSTSERVHGLLAVVSILILAVGIVGLFALA